MACRLLGGHLCALADRSHSICIVRLSETHVLSCITYLGAGAPVVSIDLENDPQYSLPFKDFALTVGDVARYVLSHHIPVSAPEEEVF